MTTTDNLTAQIEPKNESKKRGRPAKFKPEYVEFIQKDYVYTPPGIKPIDCGKVGAEPTDEGFVKEYSPISAFAKMELKTKEIDLKKDEKFQTAKESAKALFAEIDLEASNAKRLQELKNKVDEIIDELIPTLKKLSDLRKEMNK